LENFKTLTREERKEALVSMGEKAFREKQIFSWLSKGMELDEMSNVSNSIKNKILDNYSFDSVKVELVQTSKDGTKKYLLKLPDDNYVETVFMKYDYGNTLCISTQVGCNMGCSFCASTIGGKIRDLYAWEIFEEYTVCRRDCGEDISHIVLMGMGEPFDNYKNVSEFLHMIHDEEGVGLSYRNITVSSSGLIPKIRQFTEDFPQVNLAISLHNPVQEEREKIMPVAKGNKMPELMAACKEYTEKTGRRISFEYTLIEGQNDRDEDVINLSKLLHGMLCHVNLIPLNSVRENGMKGTSRDSAKKFSEKLEKRGIPATVRRSLGQDIDAACGQLRKKMSLR